MSFGDTIAQTVLGKPTVPEDTDNAPNVIAEGAAVNTSVGITAHSTFANGNAGLTYSLSADSSAGGFKIDPNTGVVTVADPSKIDFETSPGHVYTITVQATKNSQFSSEQTFTISVTDVAPSTPVDSNAAANTVAEGAANGTAVGITASATDINGPAVTWSLTGDTSGGGFTINAATGVITVADGTKIDYESSPGHAYTVTATASDGTLTTSQTFTINVSDVPLSTPVDTNAAANSVAEGAANGSTVGVTASASDPSGPATTYSLIGDTSGGGFTINASTGVVTVANPAKIDFESTAPGHTYNITVQASNGVQTTSQVFTVGVSDVAPSAPTDSNGAANTVAEGAANGTVVGVTAFSTDVNGPAPTYSLTGDTSGGGFTINAATGVVTVADHTKIDYETAPGHAYTVTAQASDGTLTSSQTFTIAVTDVAPSTPVDSNAAANTVAEGAVNGSTVGVTASSTDINGPAVTYSLTGDTSGGGFTINAATGVVTVADSTKIDYESSPGHAYTVTAQASDGTLSSSQTFTIGVTEVAPSTPVDSNAAANTVAEGAANGSTVGVTVSSIDVNGPAVTYSLTGDTSGGGFTINAATGVVTVADSTKIDYESAPGHAYTVTAQASDGTLTSSQAFVIAVTDVAPSTPVDSNAAANTVVEGAANGTTVGVTASSTDVNGPAVTYSLVGDTSGGGFTINAATGVVTVADGTKIDYETAVGHAYTVTAQASDGTLTSSQTFTIAVTDVAPSTPVDSNAAANTVAEGAANGSTVGVTASSTDINGPPVTYSLTGDTSGGGFTINAATGVVTVADSTKIDYESAPGHAYTVTAQASDGTSTSSQTFTIGVTDVAPSTPVDSNAAANAVLEGAANGSTVGVTVSSTDVNGPAVTYSLTGDTSGGGFTINAATGVVTVADSTKIDYESAPGHAYTVTAQASDGTLTSSQAFVIAVTDVAPSTPVDSNAAANTVAEGAVNGSTVGVTASSTDINGPAVTYSLTGDTSGGGFTINAATGVVTVADGTKIDYETAVGHAYTVTAQASDGTLSSSQNFTIAVTDVAPSTPVDSNAAANTVAEGAVNGSTVGVTASSTDINGPAVTYSLTGDTSGGGFTINAATGVVTVADSTKIDYESAPGHAYTVTAQASDGTQSSSQNFTIGVTDVAPSTPVDSNAAANTVLEGAANGSTVGVTASSTDVNGPAVTYSLTGDTSGGGFTIDAATGVVTVADSTKVDFESAAGHAYTVTAQASDGTLTSSQAFVIAVTDVAPSTPVDSDAAVNQVAVSAPAGTYVGVTASSTDVNGPAVTYSLTGDTSGGGFTINSATGAVTVADPSKIHVADPSYNITVDSSDGTLHSQQTFTIAVVVDAAPVVTAGHTLNYTENQAATAIDAAVTVTDSDNATLAHATVQITGNYVNGEDVLGFTNQNGITGSFNAATGTMTLTGSSSVANYQTALASVTYFNTSDNPSGAARTVTIIANDGTLDSASATDTINVTPVNDAPVVTAGHTLNYTENQAATAFDPALTVTDVDNTNLASATVQITGNYANGQDVLGFTNQNGISGSFNAGTGTLTLTGSSSVANYQTALDSITYVNTSENPSGLARTVTIIANDGALNSVAKTDTINVTPVNDAPVTTAGGTLNYTENQAATAIDATVTVSDVDSANMSSATVVISNNYVNGQDILGFTTQNGITGVFNAATGTMTLSGSSSVAHYQTALESVTYFNNSDNPSGLDRTVSYTANDGALNSNTSTSTIHVTPVNDAPVVTATGTLAYTENQAATAIAPALTVTDADTATLTTAAVQISANYVNGEDVLAFTTQNGITGSFNAATGTMTLTGTASVANYQTALESVTYVNTSENPSTAARTVTFTADDGQAINHLSAGSNHTITVASVDDAPVNNNVPSSFITQSGFAHTITGLSITDVDAGAFNDITTTFTAGAGTVSIGNGGSGTAGIAGGATVTTNGTGTVVLTGTVAQINTSLSGNNVAYTAVDNSGSPPSSTTLQMATNDHGHTGTGGPITDTDTINIGVIPQVWFINNAVGAVTDATAPVGSQANPFPDIAAFNASSGPGINDYIYVKAGTYSGDGINLKAGQTLLGDDQALSFTNPLGGPAIVIEDGTHARPTIAVTTASDQGIALASGNTVAGIIVTTSANTQVGIDDSGATVGVLNISDTDVTGGGQAINLTHGGTGGSVTLGTVSSSGGVNGIALGGALVTNFSATTGSLSGHTGSEISISGGSGTVSVGGAIGDGTGTTSVSIVNKTGGTVTLSGNITDSNDTGGGIGISGNSATTINFTGAAKTLDTGIGDGVSITSNTGSTVNFTNGGLTVHTTNGTGFQDTVSGTVSVTGSGNTISTTGTGTALNLSHVTIGGTGVTFDSASTTGPANGIVIDTVTGGAINVNGGSIAGATSNGVNINAAQDNISIAASVASTSAGHSVQVTNSGTSGGNTISFSGGITDPGLGVNLDNNDQNSGVATVNFTGALNIDSTTHTGFNATNGGTVNAGNANNSIVTTTGTALNVANTTIGSSNLIFHDISANGAANGIVLNNTGTSGHLAVTGTGTTAGSGGTIQNTTGDAISLTSTQNVSLSNMNINNNLGNGIHGSSLNGIVLTGDSLSGNANANNEAGINLTQLSGDATHVTTFTNITVANSFDHNVTIDNTSGNLTNLVVTGSTFSNNGLSTFAGSDFNFLGEGTATMKLTATNNTFSGNATGPSSTPTTLTADGLHVDAAGTSTVNAHIGDGTVGGKNTFTNNNVGIDLSVSNTAHLNFDVNDNVVTGSRSTGINFFANGAPGAVEVTNGFVHNNAVGNATVGSGSVLGNGITIDDEGGGTTTVLVDSNNVQHVGLGDGSGFIAVTAYKQVAQTGTMNLTITNNSIHDIPDDSGLEVKNNNTSGTSVMNVDVHGNTFANTNDTNDPDLRIGGGPGADRINVPQASQAAIQAANTGETSIEIDPNVHFSQGAVTQPTPTPQLALHGQGPGSSEVLAMDELTPIVAAAILHWADAGASAAQIAQLEHAAASIQIADITNANVLAETDADGTITIDANAAGWSWFVDSTPADNNEFHATATANELAANSGDAANHMDLLTVVEHELGHVIGLGDSDGAGLMNVALDVGERRLPDATDVAQADAADAVQAEAALPASAQAATSAPILVGTPGNDTIDAGLGGKILLGGGGADNFVFGPDIHIGSATAPAAQPITHVADYSAAQGDTFDFSALTTAFHASGITDNSLVRAVEDSSGTFATLQINTTPDQTTTLRGAAPQAGVPNWVNVAQIDGAHAGDAVNVLLDSHLAVHLAQIHVDLLV